MISLETYIPLHGNYIIQLIRADLESETGIVLTGGLEGGDFQIGKVIKPYVGPSLKDPYGNEIPLASRGDQVFFPQGAKAIQFQEGEYHSLHASFFAGMIPNPDVSTEE